MKPWFKKLLIVFLLFSLILPGMSATAVSTNQADDPETKARALAAVLTPEEKVGQLFLITFDGTDAAMATKIYDLITTHHASGVVLRSDNNNFVGPLNTTSKTVELIRALQNQVWDVSQRSNSTSGKYIPLFVGIAQDGDSYPTDQIINGVTPLPSPMAIGATWNTTASEVVGQVMGRELSALGFNMYIGPSLDILETGNVTGDDLGVRTFGSDPYWVGQMGKAYIRGLHLGSENQMAVIVKNFPGRGGSDRLPEEEISTVRKSMDALTQYELAPFFSSMAADADSGMQMDGVLVSHIRYQGLQENIREITPPISLDAEALKTVLSLEPAAQWYADGGLIVSDSLGSNAVRKFFDPTNQTFDARTVARNALNAGNDLLYLNNFQDPQDEDSYATIVKTMNSFVQKYQEDPAFAERVNQSVVRILTAKYKVFSNFRIDQTLPEPNILSEVGNSESTMFEVARQSVSLISPNIQNLNVSLPRPPESREQITFFTDVVTARQCTSCETQDVLGVNTLKDAIVRLYGPPAGGSIIDGYLHAYSFQDLNSYLNSPEGLAGIGSNLSESEWVVFSLTEVTSTRAESLALKRILTEHPELLRDKKVIVFAFGAPYYLDATDISKITAYYGLFSKTAPFVDMAARVLFQEVTPTGASPVSIPGVGYDMNEVTLPNENQVIKLILDLPEPVPAQPSVTPEPTDTPLFNVGDTIPLKTDVILDHNNHPVPDGTVVQFIIKNIAESGTSQQIDTITTGGIARASYKITSPASLEISVRSEPALVSQIITLNTTNGQAFISTFIPTQGPTQTPSPTLTTSPTATFEQVLPQVEAPKTHFKDWLLVNILIIACSVGIVYLGQRSISLRWGFRWAALAAMGGLFAYILLTLEWILPVNRFLTGGTWGILIATFIGVLVGWGIGWVWQRQLQKKPPYTKANGLR